MRNSASPTAMSSRMGSQTSGSRPNGPTGTVSPLVRSRAAPETRSGLAEFAPRARSLALAARFAAGIHRVQVAPCEGIVADEPSDLDEVRAIDFEDEHVIKSRHARLLAEPRRDVGANRCEVARRPRRAQYQLSASFFHA